MSDYKKGDIVNYRGYKTVVTSINPDGTISVNYASGSGKTGFAGKIPSIKSQYSRTAFTNLIKEVEPSDDGAVTLEFYEAFVSKDEESMLNGYSRGRSDMAQKMRLQVKRELRANPNDEYLKWMEERLSEIEESEYVTEDGQVSQYKSINLSVNDMKSYNSGHGVGMRDLRSQIEKMSQDYVYNHPETSKSAEWFAKTTAAEKQVEPVKKRSTSDKTPQDYLRLARYMYKETSSMPGEPRRYAGYKQYLSKVMHHYGLTSAEAYELVTGNLSNSKDKDPEPKVY
jgi:hypothetical protein